MITAFKNYLLSLSLSPISRKLYLSDLRRFLAFIGGEPTLDQLSQDKYYLAYLASLSAQSIAPSMLKRTTASLRQFTTFLSRSYGIDTPSLSPTDSHSSPSAASVKQSEDYIKPFSKYLISQHLSPLTIKSYKSDITRYLDWAQSNIASNQMSDLLTEKNTEKYLNHLSESLDALTSTIDRKSKSIARFQAWFLNVCDKELISDNNFTASIPSMEPILTKTSTSLVTDKQSFSFPKLPSPGLALHSVKNMFSRTLERVPNFSNPNYRNLATLAVLLVFASSLGIFGYRSFSKETKLIAAYPSAVVTPNRNLSFQGRLEDVGGTPITAATNFEFKLWDDLTAGTQLYTTGTCSITPDADGVFSTQIGSTCGSAINSSVFSENANIWLEVKVATETLAPRQPISSVAYALNSETIQGFPISSTISAIRNTIVPMNQWGEIIIGEQNPRMTGVSGNFQISAPSLTFTTSANGDIALSPNGTGQVNVNSNQTILGDLTITGDDLFMNTNTAGMILVADGTNFNPTAMTGDVTINGSGVTSIGSDRITESMLKSVNGATDELCLSYESTVGDFEWQTCGSGSNWTRVAGNLSPLVMNDTISATTSAAVAMTLTQTGAFNALLVEDQASDTTPFIIDQSGNVGIGISTAAAKLDLKGSGDSTGLIFQTSRATAGGNHVVIQDRGYMGIGTISPVQTLEVSAAAGVPATSGTTQNGAFRIGRNDGGINVLDFGVSGVSPYTAWIQATNKDDLSGSFPLSLQPNAGNVGIGTTAPNAKLDVAGTASVSGILTLGNGTTNTLRSPYGPLTFDYKSGLNTWGTAMTVQDSTGNIGIGITNPTEKLNINGNIKLASNGWLTSTAGYIAVSPATILYLRAGSGSNINIGDQFANNILMAAGGGNVGIGDTTPASLFTVGNGDLFQVNSSGIISNIDGVAHTIDDVTGNLTLTSNSTAISLADDVYLSSGLSTFGTAVSDGTVEATRFCTGDGETNCVTDFNTLTAGATYWTRSAGVLSPTTLNDALTATTSATVAMTLTQTGAFNALLVEDQASDTTPFVIDQSGNVGIGTATPTQQLEITGNFEMPATTFADQSGIIYKGADRFLHDFNYGNNGTVTTSGFNTFGGIQSGNFTMGSTATAAYHGSYNTGFGYQTLDALTYGYNNSGFGYQALTGVTSGTNNTGIGNLSMPVTSTGTNNSAIGYWSMRYNTTGGNNVALGGSSGVFIADGVTQNTTSDNSIYLGVNTKALADNDQNEIVIGYNATGIGSNTVTLGADTITTTALKGNVGIGVTAPTAKLDVAGTASVSGVLTLGNGTTNTLRSPYGPLTFDYKSGLNTWATAMTVQDTTGYVGIGTVSPSRQLEIYSNAPGIEFTNTNSASIAQNLFYESSTLKGAINLVGSTYATADRQNVLEIYSANDVSIWSGGSESVRVKAGNVGIGDTTPDAPLDVVGDVYISSGLSTFGTAVSDGTIEATQFCTGDGETNCVTDFSSLVAGAGYWTRTAGVLSPTTLNDALAATTSATVAMTLTQTGAFNALLVEDQASDTTPFVIDQDGNVGIGIANPGAPLTVDGTFGSPATSGTIQDEIFRIGTIGSGYGNVLDFGKYSAAPYGMWMQTSSSADLSITQYPLIMQPKGGRIGIGTTDPSAILDVAGDASVSGHLVMRGSGTNYIHTLNGSNFGISTSVGGDTGLSEKFTVLNSGNIGIGDTTPTATLTVGSGDLFQVAGTTGSVTTAGDVAINGDDLTSDGTLGVLAATGLNLQATTGTVTIDSIAAGQTLNLGNSNVARTVNIGSGTGIDTINIGTGATAADVITFGNTGAASTFTFNSGASTTNPLTFDFDTVTTGTATDLSVDGLTTGTGLLIDNNVASSLTTGTLFQAQSVATSLTTAADAFLGYFNWNPGSATTAVGDLFRINIGANGTATNLFNITDNGTSLFSVSETAVTANIPTNFTSAGDVSMSYDLNFTNLTSSTIRSASQFYLTAGETYDSSDMTLTTYNKGNIIADTEAFVTTGAATVSGTLRANGNTIFNGLTYGWPASHTASGILQNDGSGALTWATLGAAAISADSLDFTEFKDTMTLDASTDIAASGTNVLSLTNTGTGNSFLVNDSAGDTTPFVIDQSGNVGIGNTTANAPLQIYSDTGTGTGAMYLGTGANASTMISAQGRAYFGYGAGGVAVVQGALTKGIQFNVNNNTFGSGEAMRIESTGLVGIGTAGPDAKLDVLSTTEQLRLTYTDGTVYSSQTVDSSGNLTIDNTGTQTIIADDLAVNGATSADITSTTTTATVFDSTVTSLSLGSAATTLNMGAGGALARAINIGTGTGVDTINIGTGATAADVITFGNTGAASTFTFNSGASTTNPLTFDFDTVTTGTATDLSVDGLTTGTGLLIDNNVASSLTTGTLFQAQSVATSLTTAADAFLGYFNWNPGSATTAVGDLFRINIGANGTATNLFNITDNGTSLFSVSETAVTANIPTNFTSAGDVSMSYDLNFTNPTASNITSSAPLTIVAGETFNSSNLTLKTYNSGDVVIDAAGGVTLTQAQAWDLANTSVTALNIESGLLNLDTTNSRIGIGTIAPSATLDVAGTASVSGVLTLGNGTTNTLRSPYGPLSFDYKSGLNTWGTAMTVDDITGNIGIGTTSPRSKLTINTAFDGVALDIGGGQIDTSVSTRMGEVGYGFDWYYDGSGSGDANYLSLNSENAGGTRFTIFKFGHTTGGLDLYGGYASSGITIAQNGDLTSSGKIGIGNNAPVANLDVTGTASISGALTIGNAGVIRSAYDDLILQYKSGLDTWATALSIQDGSGYVFGNRYVSNTSASQYLDLSNTGTSLAISGDILNTDGSNPFSITSTTNQNIVIDAGSGTVQIGAAGAGKLDAATIDPPYTINGAKFATYMASMTGVKEETTGNIYASQYVSGIGYRATLDLATSIEGSDIWLFGKTTNLKHNLDKMVVLLSSAGNTKTWYDIDAATGKLYLYAQSPTTISYRLTAPRYDAQNWLNERDINAAAGLIVNDTSDWSVSSAIADAINAGKTQVAQLFGNVETNLISPLDTSKAITITAPVAIKPTSSTEPALSVEGEILAATISARTAILNDVQAETITAKNIVADTITANHIEGLDARIASLSGKLSDQDLTSITERIKNRLDILTGNLPNASDLPTPVEATNSAILDTTTASSLESSIATGSAILSSLSADFATINGYLAVIGQATMTDLDVTNVLYTSRIDSKTGTINLAGNTLIVDSTGTVAINGDLVVSGKVLADSASLNTLELGTPADASSSSALGQLLSIYNESGVAVATIDASGSANLASLTTNMITISGSTDATSSALLTSNISSTATAGVSTLVSPDTELTISSQYVTKDTLVYLTPTTNTQNKVLFVKSKNLCDSSTTYALPSTTCTPSFTIGIDSAATSDISFNWWLIQVK